MVHVLRDGQLLSSERVKLLTDMFQPQKKQLFSFLGMTIYCNHWICGYATIDSVLHVATVQNSPSDVQ